MYSCRAAPVPVPGFITNQKMAMQHRGLLNFCSTKKTMTNTNAPDSTSSQTSWASMLVIFLCFILSGVAALVYQTAWTRQFALVFGTSELAVASVLAAYMGGLALGAYLIEKRIKSVQRPVLWYAGLELGIALAALLLIPAGLWLAEQLLIVIFGGQASPPTASLGGTSLFYLIAAFAVLLIPTTLMGATLPLLARHTVHSEQQIGQRIGLLYAANTAGAVGGALLGALYLLPRLGLTKTVWAAAAINLFVAALALTLSKTAANRSVTVDAEPATTDPSAPAERMQASASPAWVLPLMLVSGAVSFLHEVLWTRMLGHVLGSSIYAFGVMVASFLAGIALGGGVGALLARRRQGAARWLAISELAAALAAMGAWYGIQQISAAVDSLAQRVTFGLVLLFPLAFAIGITYPLAVRVLARNVGDAAPASARVYSWNTVGAILGSIAGGFLIVPALRYEGAVHLAVIGSCLLAVVACFTLFRPSKWFAIPMTVAALAASVLFVPTMPDALLRYSPLRVNGQGEMLFYDVGRSAAVIALRQGDQIAIRTNSLPEASIDMVGTTPQLYVEAWMAPLAVLARPKTEDMLIVGFGGGRVLEAVPPSVRNIDVIELEDKVIDANRFVSKRRLRDPLNDSRVNLIINDARGALQLTDRRYDAVVSQPSHPWTAGASHLYTRQFMQQAKDHLKPGGLFVQWMNVDFLDETLLRSLLATINDVYPHVRVYRPAPPTLLFLASDQPIQPERELEATRAAFKANAAHYASIGLNAPEDLVANLALDDDSARSFASGAPVITDDANKFATASVYDFGRNISAENVGRLLAPYDPLTNPNSFIYKEIAPQLAFDYLARRANTFSQYDGSARERIAKLTTLFQNSDMQVYLQSLTLQSAYQIAQAQQVQLLGTDVYPDSQLLRDMVLEGWLGALASGNAPDNIKKLAGKISQQGSVVLRAAQAATQEDWSNVAALDGLLGQIPWTSIWNNQATQLRVEWRARVRNEDLRPKFSSENLAMIDRLNIIQQNPQLYVLRAWSSMGVNKPNTIMESIAKYSTLALQSQSVMDNSARNGFRTGFKNLSPLMAQLQNDSSVDKARYQEVSVLLNQAISVVQ